MFWESEKDERENEEISRALTKAVEDLEDKSLLKRFLLVCVVGNLVIWAANLLMPATLNEKFSLVFDLNNKIGAAILGIPFGLALWATYCLCRWKMPQLETNKNLDTDLMASFNYQTDSTKRWFVWLFSIAVGVLNVVLLMFVNLYLTDQL